MTKVYQVALKMKKQTNTCYDRKTKVLKKCEKGKKMKLQRKFNLKKVITAYLPDKYLQNGLTASAIYLNFMRYFEIFSKHLHTY